MTIKKVLYVIYLIIIVLAALLVWIWSEPLGKPIPKAIHPLDKPHTLKTINRYVIFGDSLSDTGNYPEPTNVSSPVFSNFNLYIPVSNPVPAHLYGTNGIPSYDFLNTSSHENGLINKQQKAYFSINWPLYFAYYKGVDHLLTWYDFTKNPKQQLNSINYAWASAVTGAETADGKGQTGVCFHDDGSYIGKCNRSSILKGRQTYKEHTRLDPNFDKNNSYTFQDMVIPDVGKQVELYLNDTQNIDRSNTSYIFYIGANDISRHLRAHIIKIVFGIYHDGVDQTTDGMISNVKTALSKLTKAHQASKKDYHIYILTMPNFDNLHVIHQFSMAPHAREAVDYAVKTYNNKLINAFKDDPKISVIDSSTFLNNLAKQEIYTESAIKGFTCIGTDESPHLAYVVPEKTSANTNCSYINNKDQNAIYYSWNNAHYTSPVNKALAVFLTQKIK